MYQLLMEDRHLKVLGGKCVSLSLKQFCALPVICLNSKSVKKFPSCCFANNPPPVQFCPRYPVLNVSSDKSSECFMPPQPRCGSLAKQKRSLNIKLFLTLSKSAKQCRTVLGRFALNWVIGALDTQMDSSPS